MGDKVEFNVFGSTGLGFHLTINPQKKPKAKTDTSGRMQLPDNDVSVREIYMRHGLRLGDKEVVLRAGEVAEFDCRQPHALSSADGRPAEIISLFGKQGERIHTRAAPPQRS